MTDTLAEPTSEDPLAAALSATPLPTSAAVKEPEAPHPLGETLPLGATTAETTLASPASPPTERSHEPAPVAATQTRAEQDSTKPPRAAARGATSSRSPRPQPAPKSAEEGGSWVRTAVLALIAAGASYYGVSYGVTKLMGNRGSGPDTAPTETAAASSTFVAPPVTPATSSEAVPKLQIVTSESPLPPGTDVPVGHGLLEIQVPDGTAIRVDGEYLGMGPSRRVPLSAGSHAVLLGDAASQTVKVSAGQRTLAVAGGSSPAASVSTAAPAPAPAGSP